MAAPKRGMKRTVLKDLLPPHVVVQTLDTTDKNTAIAELLNTLVIAGCLDLSREREALEAIRHRESVASTGIGSGIAIPHAKLKQAEAHGLAVGLSREGIDFNSVDSQPVHAVFLSVCPPAATAAHLALMRALAAFARQPEAAQKLAECRDRRSLLLILQETPVEEKGR